MDASDELTRRIETLAGDRISGASQLTREAVAILFAARAAHADMARIASDICNAQPTMAPIWNATAAALSEDPERLTQFAERLRRAPAALARFVVAHFSTALDQPGAPTLHRTEGTLRVVTLSYSSSVVVAIRAIHAGRPLQVACSESRPALEGRRLAADLAGAGIAVTMFSDAAIAEALDNAEALMVGADAVAGSWFLNKVGTRMLAAAAAQRGVPVYVIATRDKFVGRDLEHRLVNRGGSPNEIWNDPPAGVDVRNPYFEATPLDLVTAIISDVGILGAGMIPDVCEH